MSERLLALAWAGAIAWPALLCLLAWLWFRSRRALGPASWTLIAIITLAWTLGIRAFLWEPATLVVRRVDIVSPVWSGAPLRIGVLSDTHAGAPHMSPGRMRSIVARMNAEGADLIVLLGDYAGHHEPAHVRSDAERSSVMKGIAPLAGLEARLGVHAVLGNHDWWYDGPAIEAALEGLGASVLENEAVLVVREGGSFWLAGLADYESRRMLPSYSDTLALVPAGAPVIALSHWPDVFGAAPERVALTLAGHSHCGQVDLPFFGRLMHASEGSRRWPCGLYEERGRKLYVTGGVGVSILPVRFNQPPEIVVVTLRAAPQL
ncbi:MAG: metallophosphoesterase [Alphaproteobacteria bacterium]|nr:metallophosphoesterase [Alphaproteobacteria bacterium]